MKKFFIILFITLISTVSCQLYFHQPPPRFFYQSQPQQFAPQIHSVAHRAVVENAYRESMLPPEYMNRFYKNPRIAEALAKESWFTNQEMPVFDRAAEKIPREMIFKIFRNAGWIKRK
ncbi:uncharacterized protein LOC129613666 [Condylostylus longicornis]|uniref:uncharacterized protein LOC129613666 n=1 Tax=Condylostylus longicornis TaxID=2530218 RepID=UPI00244E50C8|nr:uncharacterized protein LOC129613666 [Condylostylus longicornis]